MSGLVGNPFLLASAAGGATGYQIERSLRFNSSDSAYLSRTPASAGNRKTWTWAGWVKRCKLGTYQTIISAGNSSPSQRGGIRFPTGDTLEITEDSSGYTLATTQVFRDVSAWYHLVVAFDSTQATSSNRIKLYVNGTQVSTFSTATYPSQNFDSVFSTTDPHRIGELSYAGNIYELDAYLADLHFCDGTAYDASAFGEFDANGIWQPKKFAGVYGSQGWKLDFSDNSAATATTLGKDSSGNGNNWTPNNLSVTAGAGNDSLVDVPTNGSEVDTGSGGQVRGNYATLNPLTAASGFTISNGNLEISSTSTSVPVVLGSIAVNSGKWYWEITLGRADAYAGAATTTSRSAVAYLGAVSGQFIYNTASPSSSWVNGNSYNYSTASTCVAGDVIGVALNFDANTITFYKNGVSQGTFSSNVLGTDTWAPAFKSNTQGASETFNFGARPFAYTAPSGFKALCTANLPAPVVTKPSTVMDVKLYTGNGSTQTISGFGFSPDFVWLKNRSAGDYHRLNDIIRGANRHLFSNTTDAEVVNDANGYLSAFTSDGFSLTSGTGVNASGNSYVAWCWDAGSSTVTNTQGSITSQVRANASAGFSIVTYTGTGANATVGHGLGVAPSMVIVKRRNTTDNWQVRHTSIAAANSIQLNLTNAAASATTVWNSTTPSSTVFSVGTDATVNASGGTYVAYCFAPVAGYSAFGSYTGNGSADGSFVYTGFRPRWVMIKATGAVSGGWVIWDTARSVYNTTYNYLFAHNGNSEGTATSLNMDIVSNGFKLRGVDSWDNSNAETYIYAAFAESPFQYARAR
jgi:hypothetical protein